MKKKIPGKGFIANVCPKCSLPKELCVCESLSQQDSRITISIGTRKWGRHVTTVAFNGDLPDMKKILKKAKTSCASGGTIRGNKIEIQGNHTFKMKKFLIKQGFPGENIEIISGITRKR